MVMMMLFMMVNNNLVGGMTYPSEKYDFVSWDDDIPNMMGKIIQMFHVPNHQPDCCSFF